MVTNGSDRPLLTEWRNEGNGWHARYLAADADDLRVRVVATLAFIVWGDDAEVLGEGDACPDLASAKLAADRAAAEWYTLPASPAVARDTEGQSNDDMERVWYALDELFEYKGQGRATENYDDPAKAIRFLLNYLHGEDEATARGDHDAGNGA